MSSTQTHSAPERHGRDNNGRRCPMCPRTFTKTEHLQRHVRSHTKEKPFQCPQCWRKYSRHDTLLRHLRDHPEREQSSDRTPGTDTGAPPAGRSSTGPKLTPVDGSENSAGRQSSNLTSNDNVFANQVDRGAVETLESDRDVDPQAPFVQSGYVASIPQGNQIYPPTLATNFMDSRRPVMNMNAEPHLPSWLIDENLDTFVFDSPFLTTMVGLGPGTQDTTQLAASNSNKPLANLQNLWFTHLSDTHVGHSASNIASRAASPLPQHQQTEVDDDYRQTLHRRLQIRPLDHSLPSAEFLNLCIAAYFMRFHPIFPVVHAPTFRPSKANSALLLSISSVGSLFTGSATAMQQGVQIFEHLHKAILASWERVMARGSEEMVSMVQASLIGQTFGLVSGEAKHLALVDAFHGTVISWGRRGKMFTAKHDTILEPDTSPYDLERKWREWVQKEELIRIALSLYIHDAELANILYHDTSLRHPAPKSLVAAPNDLFMASTPQEWAALYFTNTSGWMQPSSARSMSISSPEQQYDILLSIPQHSRFTIYAGLESVSVAILEARMSDTLTDELVDKLQQTMIDFHAKYLWDSTQSNPVGLYSGISILWHLTFMSLFSDFDLLERAIGRDGSELVAEDMVRITQWATSSMAKRCVAHGLLIRKQVENFSLGQEPAIHIPRAMFLAAVSFFCYSKFGSDTSDSLADHDDFPELRAVGANVAWLLFEANGYKQGRPAAIEANGPLCGLTDLLQRIGHWEIARKFASILGALIQSESS